MPTAVVTGSSRGIGAATAVLFAQRGYNVVINYSSSTADAEAVAAECRSAGAAGVLAVQADLGTEAGCHALIDRAASHFGAIDVLVNNAGTTTFCAHGDYGGLQAADFHRLYALNVVAPFLLVRRAHAHLSRGGAVVNVSSVAGTHGIGSSVAYCASKGALNAMTLSLARSLGESKRVTVNAVCPGFIRGEWLRKGLGGAYGDGAYERAKGGYEAVSALHSTLAPEDIAMAVVHTATTPLMTGQTIVCDGGFTLNAPSVPLPPRAKL